MGRVTVWEPGQRLGLTWTQLGWHGVSTDIEATFEPSGEGRLVRLEHTGFERVPEAHETRAGYEAYCSDIEGDRFGLYQSAGGE